MKHHHVYTLQAVLLTIILIFNVWAFLTLISLWIGISLVAVSLAYYRGWSMFLRKKDDGKIPLYLRWIYSPYLIYVSIYNNFELKRDLSPSIQEIEPGLFIGARIKQSDIPKLEASNIDCVLDVTAEFDGLATFVDTRENIEYLSIPILDHATPKDAQLVQACSWISTRRKQGKTILVHCALGRGRSVYIVTAYLIFSGRFKTVDASLKDIQSKRVRARLNKVQLKKLQSSIHRLNENIEHKKRAVIIANPTSGGAKWQVEKDRIFNYLKAHYNITLYETTDEERADAITRKLIDDGGDIDLVIACGGDGTIREVANELVHTEIPLGIMPIGTANALSHVLSGWESKVIPVDVACQTIIDGNIQTIDTLTCNNERVLLGASIGVAEKMMRYADQKTKTKLGQIAYIHGFFFALTSLKNETFDISLDNASTFQVSTKSLVISNAAPPTTILACGNGTPNYEDGFLDVTWLKKSNSLREDFRALAELADENNQHKKYVNHRFAKTATISNSTAIQYVIDGELRSSNTIEVSVDPKSLKVFAPKIEDDEAFNETFEEALDARPFRSAAG